MSTEPAEDLPVPSAVEFIGPFEHHVVQVHGCVVPFLTAQPLLGGKVNLVLDDRYVLWDLPLADAERIVPFIADCIAVAQGFTCHPTPEMEVPVTRTPYSRMRDAGI